MYLNGKKRFLGDAVTSAELLADVTGAPVITAQPVNVSPLVLGGLGLLAFAFVVSTTKRATVAVGRKSRAVRRALRA